MDVNKAIGQLYEPAKSASGNAYSPYSGARVGASIIDGDGRIYSGCNVENASYGLTQCAERNALAAALAAGMQPGNAKVLLIYATGFEVLAPCGACRQVMSELLAQDAVIISCHSKTEYSSWSIGELLPDSFVLE